MARCSSPAHSLSSGSTFCDVLLACYVLLKIGYPGLNLPDVTDGIVGNAGDTWHDLAPAAMAAYFS
jgi:hypothetical protein